MRPGPEDYENYAGYLDTIVWPSASSGTNICVTRDEMSPQQAASSLAKLVRWARARPEGYTAQLPTEDDREEHVRKSRLGQALAARACNLEEEHFHALYGEFGDRKDADPHHVMAHLAVKLQEAIGDWPLNACIALASDALSEIYKHYEIKERL